MSVPRRKRNPLFEVLVGDGRVGKSCLLQTFMNRDRASSPKTEPTTGVDFKDLTQPLSNGKEVECTIYDTAGQDRFATMTASYYKKANVIWFVFALDDRKTFENLRDKWMPAVFDYVDRRQFIGMVLGNKCDKANHSVSKEEATSLAEQNGMKYHEVSALNGTNVIQTFDRVTEAAYQEFRKDSSSSRLASSALPTDPILEKKNKQSEGEGGESGICGKCSIL